MPTSQTVDTDTTILTGTFTKTLPAKSTIALKSKEILSKIVLTKTATTDDDGEIIVTQTTPTAPTLLTATDLKLGDKIRVVWSGSGPFYNVYYKLITDIPFTKANANPLPSSQTQYDIGGLTTNADYTLMIRAVNGVGIESVDSNTIT